MNLRSELEPNIKKAEELFPTVISLISTFDTAFDKGDKGAMDLVINELCTKTGKQVSNHDLYEYWSYTSIENLAFEISLPSPQKVEDITKEEISEIEERIESLYEQDANYYRNVSEFLFEHGVTIMEGLENYYNNLLDRNVPTPPENVIHL